jgi:hypothetical protein
VVTALVDITQQDQHENLAYELASYFEEQNLTNIGFILEQAGLPYY